MTFVALWRLSHYDVCRLWRLSHYDVCRLLGLSPYDVCRIMTFVALWCFFALWRLSFMTFVALWCLMHYDVCRQLWRLWLLGFVAVSIILATVNQRSTGQRRVKFRAKTNTNSLIYYSRLYNIIYLIQFVWNVIWYNIFHLLWFPMESLW